MRDELRNKLSSLIKQHGLEAAEELIFTRSEECIAVVSEGADDYSGIGKSRFGGEPDLPEDFQWPREKDYQDKEKSLNFICQINFAELPRLEGIEFPAKGLLSLFVSYMESAAEPARVVCFLFDPDSQTLARRESPPEDELIDEYLVNLKPNRVSYRVDVDCDPYDRGFQRQLCAATGDEESRGHFLSMSLELESGKGRIGKLFGFANTSSLSDYLLQQVALSQLGLREHQFTSYWDSIEEFESDMESYSKKGDAQRARYERMRPGVITLAENREAIGGMVGRWRHFLMIHSNRQMDLQINDADPMYVFIEKDKLPAGDFSNMTCEVTQG